MLEANRHDRQDRSWEPRQAFYAGLRKPRELTHDSTVYRAYPRAEERLQEQGGRVEHVVLDYELKRDYQRFLHERNRGRKDCDGRPNREPEEIAQWAREHDLPHEDGHVHFPDARIEYEDRDDVLESISGHLSRRMLEHYSHIRIDAKRQALDALDAARRNAAANGNGELGGRFRCASGRRWNTSARNCTLASRASLPSIKRLEELL